MTIQQDNRVSALAYPAINWSDVPLAETAIALRHLASALLDRVFDPRREPSHQLWDAFAWRRSRLGEIFPGMNQFAPASPSRKRRRKGRRFAFLRDRLTLLRLRITKPPKENDHRLLAYWRPLLRYTHNGHSEAVRGRIMTRLLAGRFYGKDTYLLPHYLWRTAAHLAFNLPQFQLRVAREIQEFLTSRTLIPAHHIPPIQVSSATFWILILLYQPPLPDLVKCLSPSWYRRQRSLRRLAQKAEHLARGSGWAGFWDQWLLFHYLVSHPHILGQINPLLRTALVKLPFLQGTTISKAHSDSGEMSSAIELAHTSWREPAPLWIRQLYPSDLWEAPSV